MTMWKDELVLIRMEDASADRVDDAGIPIAKQEQRRTVYANKRAVGYGEFYKAAIAGYTVELKFDIRSEEYDGETMAEYDGRRYRILRTYTPDMSDNIELTLSDQSTRGGLPVG